MDNITKLIMSASDRILLLDGAIGTLLQSMNLNENDFRGDRFTQNNTALAGNFDILSLTKPESISLIHKSYLEAGADIIKTNTFNGSVLEQSHYDTQDYVYEINLKATRLARIEADNFTTLTSAQPRFVAGVIGPTRYVCSADAISKNYGFELRSTDEITESYTPQIQGLIDGGVDFLLLETIYNAENAKAALTVLNDIGKNRFPVSLSATVIPEFDDEEIEKLINDLIDLSDDYNVFCLGLNCSTGKKETNKYLEIIANSTNSLTSFYPSAGLPDNSGKYPITRHQLATIIKKLAENKLINIVGGCCGTTQEYIRLLSKVVRKIKPRTI